MSMKLNLAEHLLSHAHAYLRLGRDGEARGTLERLLALAEIPSEIAEEAEATLAEICFRQNQPRRARRHLHVALTHAPDCAGYHHLLGVTLEEDQPERALRHFRDAVRLDPEDAEFQSDLGLCLIALGERDAGLEHLRRAVEAEPDDPGHVRQLMRNLIESDRAAEARSVVLAALFRHPHDSRFRSLWSEFRFREAEQTQRRELLRKKLGDRPVLLPFPERRRPVSRVTTAADGATMRIDGPMPLGHPHLQKRATRRQQP